MIYSTLLVEKKAPLCIITINRPEVLNAINAGVIADLQACFDAIRADADVRAVILTGSGPKAFVAGADIKELAQMSPADALALSLRGKRLCDTIDGMGIPVIAAVNGFALGGGCELACACTFRICSENARFGQPEVKLGIMPGFGGTQRFPRLVGLGRALDLLLSGDQITAEDACRIGLVNRVVPQADLLATAEKIALTICSNGPLAARNIIEAAMRGASMTLDQGLLYEAQVFASCFTTEDQKEGTRAFIEKRKPSFTGR
ncbi:MAG: enoyl-CoA hydratase-related protein [Acidobacteriota bacterium]